MPDPFGVEIYDIPPINEMTKNEWHELAKICLKHLVWVIKDQYISKKNFAKFAYSWGKPHIFFEKDLNLISDEILKEKIQNELSRMCLNKLPGVSRVTGIRNDKNETTGIFADGELNWHSNESGKNNPHPVVLLHAISGTKNTQTQFLENVTQYQKLSFEDKKFVDSLKCVYECKETNIFENELNCISKIQKEIVKINTYGDIKRNIKNLIQTSPGGHTGFAFNYFTFEEFENKTKQESNEIKDWLKSLLINDKYVYTHNWNNGDIMAFDQIVTLHRRPTKDCSKRLLHRIACNFDKVLK